MHIESNWLAMEILASHQQEQRCVTPFPPLIAIGKGDEKPPGIVLLIVGGYLNLFALGIRISTITPNDAVMTR